MLRPFIAAIAALCVLFFPCTSARASRSDGHFPLPECASLSQWAVTFHQSTGGELSGDLLSYDGAGRLKQDAYWDYTWDAAGRLTGMTHRPGTFSRSDITAETVAFGYDADGRRTTKTHTTVDTGGRTRTETSKVLWAGWLPIMEDRTRIVDGATTTLPRRWFQWGADLSGTLDGAGGIGGLVAILEDGNAAQGTGPRTLLPVQDGLGNVTAVIDAATGQTVVRYEFGPFGEPLSESGEADVCPFRWQTKWYDAESQHYYFGYRHYDPRLGRWLSRDPLGEAGGFNLYAYCGNDPVNRHDPLGLAERIAALRTSDLYQAWIAADWNNGNYLKAVGDFFGAVGTGITGSVSQAAIETKDALPIAGAQMDAAMGQLSNQNPLLAFPARGINWFAQGALHLNPMILAGDLSLVADNGLGNTVSQWGGTIASDLDRIFTEGSWDAIYDSAEDAADLFTLWQGGKAIGRLGITAASRTGTATAGLLRGGRGATVGGLRPLGEFRRSEAGGLFGTYPTAKEVGPSGRISAEKFLDKRWDKATFPSVTKSVEYHVARHGKGLTAVQYTQRAVRAFDDLGATRASTIDLSGRAAVKVESAFGTGLFTPHGKIIWFHPKL